MNASFSSILSCPNCLGSLNLKAQKWESNSILSGDLNCTSCRQDYPITDGIARFVTDKSYNKSWDFKWFQIDGGRGLNYLSIDKNDPAYDLHGIFHRNTYHGEPFCSWVDKLVLDAGCGVGQNSYELLKLGTRVVALDLTRGVDIFRRIMMQRFPELKDRLLIVQADIFHLPFPDEIFDGIISFGVLHHTGDTFKALRRLTEKLKPAGDINIWIYSSDYTDETKYQFKDKSANRRIITLLKKNKFLCYYRNAVFYGVLRNALKWLPDRIKYYLLFIPASDLWYKICRTPYVGLLGTLIFHTCPHPNFRYRLINLFDAFSPRYSSFHSEKEVRSWFKELNLEVKGVSAWKLGMWGKKKDCKI